MFSCKYVSNSLIGFQTLDYHRTCVDINSQFYKVKGNALTRSQGQQKIEISKGVLKICIDHNYVVLCFKRWKTFRSRGGALLCTQMLWEKHFVLPLIKDNKAVIWSVPLLCTMGDMWSSQVDRSFVDVLICLQISSPSRLCVNIHSQHSSLSATPGSL